MYANVLTTKCSYTIKVRYLFGRITQRVSLFYILYRNNNSDALTDKQAVYLSQCTRLLSYHCAQVKAGIMKV